MKMICLRIYQLNCQNHAAKIFEWPNWDDQHSKTVVSVTRIWTENDKMGDKVQDGWAERGIGSKVNSRLTIPCSDAGSVGTVFFLVQSALYWGVWNSPPPSTCNSVCVSVRTNILNRISNELQTLKSSLPIFCGTFSCRYGLMIHLIFS